MSIVRSWCVCVALLCAGLPAAPLFAQEAKPEATEEAAKPKSKEEEYYELMQVLADTFEQIERNYVKDVDRRKLVESAVRGMLEELDPYSNYISPDETSRFQTQVEGEFGGIGIQVGIDHVTKRLQVSSPLPGTPAYKAGVRAGDLIMEVEGKSTEGMTMDQAIKVLKGKPGESVKIGVLHQGGNKIEQMSITRAIIHVSTVLGDSYKSDDTWNFFLDPEKKIAYIRLTSFSRDTTKELRAAMDEISQQGLKGLILDLRFNPGGLLTAATEISDMFLEEGKIVSTKGRNTPEKTWNAKKADTYSGFPMAILVNRYSASASEIVSAALQDHQRAAIVGERTWGKGSVQNVIELESGRSLLKLTTASYHRPSGKNIHRFPGAAESEEWGVMPDKDFDVKFSGDEMEKYLEHRRKKDVLTKEPVKSDFVDSQLAKALAFVEAKLKEAPAEEEKKAADKDPKKPEDKAAALR
jgi:carboxyl-terminal processing protease